MNTAPQKSGPSTGRKVATACGIGCLAIAVLLSVLAVVAYRFAMNKVREITAELEQLGFPVVQRGQMVEVRDEITKPGIYMGQLVKIHGNCTTNLAIVAQAAQIDGRVDGKTYFRGQVLTIEPNADLRGGLDVKAQTIQLLGKVQGEITGQYQTLDDRTAQKK